MRVTSVVARVLLFSTLLLAVSAPAQVLAPEEILDPNLRELQRKYFSELKRITEAAAAHSFPYHFYFSRVLDLTEKDQRKTISVRCSSTGIRTRPCSRSRAITSRPTRRS